MGVKEGLTVACFRDSVNVPAGISRWISDFKAFFLDAVFDHQFVQLAGTDARIFRGMIDPAFAANKQVLDVLAFKVFGGMSAGFRQRKVVLDR